MRKILLVDDQREFLELISQFLAGKFEIITAENGEEGLEKFKRKVPSLIITDLVMPTQSGLDFIKTIRAFNSETPIIVMTGKEPNDPLVTKALAAGANAAFHKPFSPIEVLLMAEQLLDDNEDDS